MWVCVHLRTTLPNVCLSPAVVVGCRKVLLLCSRPCFFFFIEATTDKRRKSINNVCIIFAVNSRLETPDTLVYCRDGHETIVLLLYVRNRPGPQYNLQKQIRRFDKHTWNSLRVHTGWFVRDYPRRAKKNWFWCCFFFSGRLTIFIKNTTSTRLPVFEHKLILKEKYRVS